MNLYKKKRHTTLSNAEWNEETVKSQIQQIVSEVEEAYDSENFWSIHPRDNEFAGVNSLKSLYAGALGVIWSLDSLSRSGHVNLKRNYRETIEHLYHRYQEEPDTREVVPSYFLGNSTILLLWYHWQKSKKASNLLWETISSNIANKTNETLWAAPGTMLAALQMYEWTNEEKWQRLFLDNVNHLWQEWKWEEEDQTWLWTQDMYGSVCQYLGAGHGQMGNLYPLLRGQNHLSQSQRETLLQRTTQIIKKYAMVDENTANWPIFSSVSPKEEYPNWQPKDHKIQESPVQWCHGAPGFITTLSHFPQDYDSAIEDLLHKGGELIWQAGPLIKGCGLCHGTDGNGYSFLQLYKRTQNPIWWEKAKKFAMTAIEQCSEEQKKHQQYRYSLWTGDLGLCIYLRDCLLGHSGWPTLDYL